MSTVPYLGQLTLIGHRQKNYNNGARLFQENKNFYQDLLLANTSNEDEKKVLSILRRRNVQSLARGSVEQARNKLETVNQARRNMYLFVECYSRQRKMGYQNPRRIRIGKYAFQKQSRLLRNRKNIVEMLCNTNSIQQAILYSQMKRKHATIEIWSYGRMLKITQN